MLILMAIENDILIDNNSDQGFAFALTYILSFSSSA